MESRKHRRHLEQNGTKIKPDAKKKLVIMIISIALMFFSVTQVYYLAKYTLGHDISQDKLKVYRWVSLLLK